MRDSGRIVVVGVAVVEEVGVAEGVEEGEEAGVAVAIETEETMMTMMVAMINMIMKRGRKTTLGIAEMIGIGTETVVIVTTNDGREGEEGAGEEEEEGGGLAAIVMMREERREGIRGDVTTWVMAMKEVERDKIDAVKAETEMIGTERIMLSLMKNYLLLPVLNLRGNHPIACSGKRNPSKRQVAYIK